MSYEVCCRGEHGYFVPMVATQSDGRRQPEIEAEKLRDEIKSRGFTFIEADTQIKLTCYATGEDGLKPTAEWQSIQTRLSDLSALKAELERVKAERDNTRRFASDLQEQLGNEIEIRKKIEIDGHRLQRNHDSLLSRLPVNRDGEKVLWGDDVYIWSERKAKKCEVIGVKVGIDGKYKLCVREECPFGIRSPWVKQEDCFSSAESCIKSITAEGEDG